MSLELAYFHKDALYQKLAQSAMDPKYQYYFATGYHIFENKIDGNDWENVQMVSVCNDEIIGYFNASIYRTPRYVNQLGCINFSDDPFVFSRDLIEFISRLFEFFNFKKICFSVAIGNPSESMYDKIANILGARVVGKFTDHYETPDGEVHDAKWYEIMESNYRIYKEVRRRNKQPA